MIKQQEEVLMGDLATVMTTENWQNTPETIMEFLLVRIKSSDRAKRYFSVLSEERFSYDEMMIVSAELEEISDLRKEVKSISYFRSWWRGSKKELLRREKETLDLRRVCQYFLYSYIQAGGRRNELLPKFMNYTCEHF